ncbi:LysR substrate-binding domain-containing protein [Ammonicoccus fulvus]|uniref:LysR substrate-binding domain-containing protein n=1 Tax=Ammonicoccus fulvus TaxID=3138240 RepID=A0ABZ3FNC2_9ACTN
MGISEEDRLDPRLKLRHLMIVTAIAQHGSVLGAADALFLTQPVVSRALQELEAILGVRLFDRGPRGVTPTESGRSFVERALAVQAELRLATEHLNDLADGRTGTLTIGTFVTAAPLLVPNAILELRRHRPGLRVTVREGTVDDLLAGVLSGEIDAVAGRAPRVGDERLAYEELYREPTVAVAAVDHPVFASGRPPALEDLMTFPWVLPLPETDLRRELQDLFAARPREVIECSTAATVRHLLRQGEHLGILPFLIAREDPELAVVPTALPTVSWSIGVTTRRTANPGAATTGLLAAFRQVAEPIRQELDLWIDRHYPGR